MPEGECACMSDQQVRHLPAKVTWTVCARSYFSVRSCLVLVIVLSKIC